MEVFNNGSNAHTRMVVDACANGTLLDKSYNGAYEIQERITNNNYQYRTTRVGTGRRVVGAIELDAITSLTTQEMKAAELACVYCREDHVSDECPLNLVSVYYMGNFNRNNNPYSNTYNLGWKQNLISVGVSKGCEIPAMLFEKMLQVHHLDTINPYHGKMLSKIQLRVLHLWNIY
ncbi:Retrotransposon gag protein [Gossypium australe]|uniref:Retrotransposon gag protein n=1 Tax=Gossypium australe TaxID=47621 RepID=A0A5B6VZ84_9ROSI|nr:Retrotransposon gag protein [Gossypium australe]